jgi:hypothetical protein
MGTTRGSRLNVVLMLILAAAAAPALFGCGSDTAAPVSVTATTQRAGEPAVTPGTATTALQAETTSTSEASTVVTSRATVAGVFADIAQSLSPLVIFAPSEVPDAVELAPQWLPVLDSSDPAADGQPRKANPSIVGEGEDAEVQVVLTAGGGWMVVIENFHGDLGDVSGKEVGKVDGIPAYSFEVNGGELIQWSFDGKWYGVFGRGVSKGAILALALGMVQAPAESL